MHEVKILVPKFCDDEIIRAQDLNAKNLLKNFSNKNVNWHTFSAETTDKDIIQNKNIKVIKFHNIAPSSYFHVKRKRKLIDKIKYKVRIFIEYNKHYDAIFYPGWKDYELFSLSARIKVKGELPIIATAESLFGGEEHARVLSKKYGHPVYTLNDMSKFKLYKYASSVIAVSPLMRDFVNMFIKKKCVYIPLGIDMSIFNEKNAIDGRPLRIVNVGRLRKEKRPDLFVKIAKSFPNIEFLWYGDGPLKKSILRMIKDEKIDNVKILSPVSQLELSKILNTARIFLSTSCSEVFPKVTLEAQACGTPVISFGYYRSPIVKHKETGLIAWSEEEMIDYIKILINDEVMQKEYSKASIENAEYYDWKNISPLWEEFILGEIG